MPRGVVPRLGASRRCAGGSRRSGEEFAVVGSAQGAGVERIDGQVNLLDDEEVTTQNLVDDRGEEVGGPELTQAGLAGQSGSISLDGWKLTAMDGHDHIIASDDIQLRWRVGNGPIGRWFEGLDRQVKVVAGPCRARLSGAFPDPNQLAGVEAQRIRQFREDVFRPVAIDVDPEQLVLLDGRDGVGPGGDLTVASLRIEQASRGHSHAGQDRVERSIALTTATSAMAYWRTIMDRSVGALRTSPALDVTDILDWTSPIRCHGTPRRGHGARP